MCIICDDYNKSIQLGKSMITFKDYAIRNLFEMKESIGVEHTKDVLSLLEVSEDIEYNEKFQINKIANEIIRFVKPKEEQEQILDRSQL